MKKITCNCRGGPMCPPVRRADTQVGPYTHLKIDNSKWVGIFALVVTFAMTGAVAQAQQPTKVPRIAYLTAASLSDIAARAEAFRQGLRELGYVEGKNIVIEWRDAKG